MAQLRYKYKDPVKGLTLGFSASKHYYAKNFFASKGITDWWSVDQTTTKAIEAMPKHIPTDIDDYEGAHAKNRAELKAAPIEERPLLIAKFLAKSSSKTIPIKSLHSSSVTANRSTDTSIMSLTKTGTTRVYIIIGVILLIITLIAKKLLK